MKTLKLLFLVVCLFVGILGIRIHPSSRNDTILLNSPMEGSFRRRLWWLFDTDSSHSAKQHLRFETSSENFGETKERQQDRVSNFPGASEELSHFAGHINVNNHTDSNIFYWLFEAENPTKSTPLLIWLNGGPGCSSMDGLFLELGPFRIDPKNPERVVMNPHSWHKIAHLLFIDQPVGTGFSFTKKNSGYCTNDEDINRDFLIFLDLFVRRHSRFLSEARDENNTPRLMVKNLYFSGESHAGHYIPSMAQAIVNRNQKDKSSILYDIQGLALGNPWINPHFQYDASEVAYGLGLISRLQRLKFKQNEKKCQDRLRMGQFNQPICFALLDDVIEASKTANGNRVLMYDARKFVSSAGSFPPGHELVERMLNRPSIRQLLHATSTPHRFQECTDPPYHALVHQDGKGVKMEMEFLLNSGIRIFVFAGQYDLICNHIGIEKSLYALNWSGAMDFRASKPLSFPSNDVLSKNPVGYVQSSRNLIYLRGSLLSFFCSS